MVTGRPGVIVIVIVTITFFTAIVNLILKVIVIEIVDKVIVIHYYFAITFCQTHNTFCQICHCTVKSHCHLIGCSIKLSFIILFIIDSVAEKPLHLKQTKHCVLNRIQVDYYRAPNYPPIKNLNLASLISKCWHYLCHCSYIIYLVYRSTSYLKAAITAFTYDIHISWFLIYFMLYSGYYQ